MTQQGQIPTDSFYQVQAGDTLSGIAQRAYNHGSQPYWTAIYRVNQNEIGNDPNLIQPGMYLYIPRFAASPQADRFYIVQAGDTLSGIAQRAYNHGSQPYWTVIYRVNQNEIGNDPNVIHQGEALYIPPIVSPPQQNSFYLVQAGDTLWGIAQQAYGDGNVDQQLYNVNKKVIGDDPNLILPGQILFLQQGLFPPGAGPGGGGGNIHIPKNSTWG